MSQRAPAAQHRSSAEILASPNFSRGRYIHCVSGLELFSDPNFVRVNMAVGRNLLFSVLMCLYAGYDPADRQTWPTLGRLLTIVSTMNMGSRRKAEDYVGRLKDLGFLVEMPAINDRRAKLLIPTTMMIEHDRRYSAALFSGLAVLPPVEYYSAGIAEDPTFHMAHRRIGLANLDYAPNMFMRHRGLFQLFDRDGAYGTVCWLVVESEYSSPITLSYTGLARKLCVSRSHARNLITDLDAEGWIEVSGSGDARRVKVLPKLFETLDPFLADVMSAQDRLAWQTYYGEKQASPSYSTTEKNALV